MKRVAAVELYELVHGEAPLHSMAGWESIELVMFMAAVEIRRLRQQLASAQGESDRRGCRGDSPS